MMTEPERITSFASPERVGAEEIQRQREEIMRVPMLAGLLDSIPQGIVVLNHCRQIIFANRAFEQLAGRPSLGCRLGEALVCLHSHRNLAGCGTTEFCEKCGGVNAVLSAQSGRADVQECRITQQSGEGLDLEVHTTPFELEDRNYTLFCVVDKSHEKRRRVMERIFFHDILNTVGGLYGFADLLQETAPPGQQTSEFARTIFQLSASVIDEIEAQKELAAAENNELSPSLVPLDASAMLEEVMGAYVNHEVARGKFLRVSDDTRPLTVVTDRILLRRVLGNMTKNALEASRAGETVTLSCIPVRGCSDVLLTVHNPGTMSRDVQLQVFQRSFSTKGRDRGLGTYSIKLLGERYLGGKVSFETYPETGTTFSIQLPLQARRP